MKRGPLIVVLFLLLTLVMTYPLVLHLGSKVRDRGDPLLNSWILAWNADRLAHGDAAGFFNANIFYPHPRTLAYSEILFTQSLVAFPVLQLSANPILAHNFVVLLAFLTTGLGMFFLARHLTRDSWAAAAAGTIFAFSPFMFAHLFQVQVLTAAGIPLAFLFLHRYFERGRFRDMVYFGLAYAFQALANGYYALYLAVFVLIFLLIFVLRTRSYRRARFWVAAGCAVLIIAVLVGPFFIQYFKVQKEMGFARNIGFSARLVNYLATSPLNRVYGRATARFHDVEGELFPGIAAFFLAVLGGLMTLKVVKRPARPPRLVPFALCGRSPWTYGLILVLAFFFTFGEKGPYVLLHKFVPGFNGLRAASRFHIFVMFGLSVFAAYGIQALRIRLRHRAGMAVPALIILVILAEYASFPLPLFDVPVKERIPRVYAWLAGQEGKAAVVELPLPSPKAICQVECTRVYYSSYHKKSLVNGFSGFIPPLYAELMNRWKKGSYAQLLEDFQDLGVRYILVHPQQMRAPMLRRLRRAVAGVGKEIRPMGRFGATLVYELAKRPEAGRLSNAGLPEDVLQKEGWRARASVNAEAAPRAIDDFLDTRWDTAGVQNPGQWFEIDLGRVACIAGLSFKLGRSSTDYPRGLRVEVSNDLSTWRTVLDTARVTVPIRSFLKPSEMRLDFNFPAVEARAIRLVQTGKTATPHYWSIHEADVITGR